MAAAKELSACRTVSEFVEKQAAFGKASFENFVAEATRLNEMYVAAAKDACAPLNARLTAAADIVKVALALWEKENVKLQDFPGPNLNLGAAGADIANPFAVPGNP